MPLTWDNIQANAVVFSKRWKDVHNEEAEAQSFETDFLRVFGVTDPVQVGDFEYKIPLSDGKTGYVDYCATLRTTRPSRGFQQSRGTQF